MRSLLLLCALVSSLGCSEDPIAPPSEPATSAASSTVPPDPEVVELSDDAIAPEGSLRVMRADGSEEFVPNVDVAADEWQHAIWRRRCREGVAWTCLLLARDFAEARALEADAEQAQRYRQVALERNALDCEACEAGAEECDARSCVNLAKMYDEGIGVTANSAEGLRYRESGMRILRRRCADSNLEARPRGEACLGLRDALGDEEPRHLAQIDRAWNQALRHLRRACLAEEVLSCVDVSSLYLDFDRVHDERSGGEWHTRGVEFAQRRCPEGDAEACTFLESQRLAELVRDLSRR